MAPYTDDKFKEKVSLLDRFIRGASCVAVVGHFNPDGDAVGSVTAMSRYISGRGGHCIPVLPSPHPAFLNFLDPSGEILFFTARESLPDAVPSPEKVSQTLKDADLIICADFNTPARTEGMEGILRTASCRRVLIDHHPGPEMGFFDLMFSDTGMSSACELLFWILMEMPDIGRDVKRMDITVAESLAAGMISDTNNFCNSVIPSTFRMASALLERGVSLETLHSRLFNCYSENRMRLMGEMLSLMHTDSETHSACMILTRKLQYKYSFLSGDSEGFVNLGLRMADVEVSALCTEEKDRIRVSLRSKGRVSVNRLSERFFNGGGHEKASGGRIDIPVGKVRDYFFSSLKTFITEEGITFAEEGLR